MKVQQVNYNWHSSVANGEEFASYQVGKYANCLDIKEHYAEFDGDRWYYDVTLNDGSVTRIFNVNQVFYFKEETK